MNFTNFFNDIVLIVEIISKFSLKDRRKVLRFVLELEKETAEAA